MGFSNVPDMSISPRFHPQPRRHRTSTCGLILNSRDGSRTFAGSVQWLHIENVNALHLPQNFESLQTSRLLQVRGNRANCCSGANEVRLVLDLCVPVSPVSL